MSGFNLEPLVFIADQQQPYFFVAFRSSEAWSMPPSWLMILASIYNPRNSQQPTVVLNSTEQPIIAIQDEPGPSRLNLKSSQTFRSGIVQASSATARSRGNSISCHKDVAGIPHIHKLGRVTRERKRLRK